MDDIRVMAPEEIGCLRPLLEELAAYHNRISLHHAGAYPAHPIAEQLTAMEADVRDGRAAVYVAENGEEIYGFCMLSVTDGAGAIKYLIVTEAQRGKCLGRRLMDAVLARLSALGVRRIEVKVIAGSPALCFYEGFGFKMNAHLLWKNGK